MKINEAGIELIKSSEGLRLDAYRDVAGVLTIGYGHTGADVHEGAVITEAEAEKLLKKDIARFEKGVTAALSEPIEKGYVGSNEFSAFVSLAYNIGLANFKSSTALRMARKNRDKEAADAILWWNRATIDGKKQVVRGLVLRRKAERKLYLTPDEVTSDASVDAPGGLKLGCGFWKGFLV